MWAGGRRETDCRQTVTITYTSMVRFTLQGVNGHATNKRSGSSTHPSTARTRSVDIATYPPPKIDPAAESHHGIIPAGRGGAGRGGAGLTTVGRYCCAALSTIQYQPVPTSTQCRTI